MTKYSSNLPQLGDKIFISDGGLETSLIFHDGFDLPDFAAFTLLRDVEGKAALEKYYRTYLDIAVANKVGFILETATWRASSDWAKGLGYSPEALKAANEESVDQITALRNEYETEDTPIVVSGNLGPQSDGYAPGDILTAKEAEAYHKEQIVTLANAGVDVITAITMTYIDEAIGVTKAAQSVGLPVVIGFTTETDGRLPTDTPLGEAVEAVDVATGNGPAYYMVNCAHSTHFQDALDTDADWVNRIKALRANASKLSHAELDEAEELDDGNPAEFGAEYQAFKQKLPNLTVFGGCCGTDHRHIEAVCKTCAD